MSIAIVASWMRTFAAASTNCPFESTAGVPLGNATGHIIGAYDGSVDFMTQCSSSSRCLG